MWNKQTESESGLHTMQPLRTRIEGTVVGDGNLVKSNMVYKMCNNMVYTFCLGSS